MSIKFCYRLVYIESDENTVGPTQMLKGNPAFKSEAGGS